MSKRAKVWAKQARVNLLLELGAFCHWPGCCVNARRSGGGLNLRTARRLEFDHIWGRDWECTGKSTDQRMLMYRKEAAAGQLQVLCDLHNRIKGDPTGRVHWKDAWFADLYAGAFAERVEA